MHNNPYFNVFLDHIMNLYKMIEILLKYDNMHIIGVINALNCINNHIITCINNMLSFNVFIQTHLSSSSLKNDVVIMNQNSMHDKKIPQDPNHNYSCYE